MRFYQRSFAIQGNIYDDSLPDDVLAVVHSDGAGGDEHTSYFDMDVLREHLPMDTAEKLPDQLPGHLLTLEVAATSNEDALEWLLEALEDDRSREP